MTTTKPLGIAVLSFAHSHANRTAQVLSDLPDVDLVAIADEEAERGQAAADRFGATWLADYHDVLAREDIDAVVICSENSRHREMTIAAAEAGKHVLCEKPLATTVEDAQAMIDACKKHGVKLQTAFPVRFTSSVIAMKDAIKAGRIGTPLAIVSRNPGSCPHSWFVDPELSGGGAVMDHTVHVVDVLRWVFEEEITDVFAEAETRMHDIPVEDTGLLLMKLGGTIPVSLDTSWSRPKSVAVGGVVSIEVIGENGVLFADPYDDTLELAIESTGQLARPAVEANGHPDMIRSFVDAVMHDTEPLVTGEDGLRALQVALCAYESIRTGEVVEVPSQAIA